MKKPSANPKPEAIQCMNWGRFWLQANNWLKKKRAGASAKPIAVEASRYNNKTTMTYAGREKRLVNLSSKLFAGGFFESSSAKGSGLS
jgi:hypothetical protein